MTHGAKNSSFVGENNLSEPGRDILLLFLQEHERRKKEAAHSSDIIQADFPFSLFVLWNR